MINIKCEKGAALIFTIFVLMLVSAIGFSFFNLATTEYKISNTEKKGMQAFYLAEAGIEKALLELYKGENDIFEINLTDIADGTISVRSKKLAGTDTLQIISEARVLDTSKIVTVVAAKSFFSNAILGFSENKDLASIFGRNCKVTGDVVVNHNLEIQNLCYFSANVLYKGTLRELKNTEDEYLEIIYRKMPLKTKEELPRVYTINDFLDENLVDPKNNPNLKRYDGDLTDPSFFRDSEHNIFLVNGNLFLRDTILLDNAVIIVKGYADIENNASLHNVKIITEKDVWIGKNAYLAACEIISKGSINIAKNLEMDSPKKANFIAAEGNLEIDTTSSFYGVLFSNSKLSIGPASNINGSIAAKKFFINEDCSLTYSKDIVKRAVNIGNYEIIKWAEK